jgi:hypothetical protein
MFGHHSQILGDFRPQKSRPITEEYTPHQPGRKSGIFWPRERERRQNSILVPQHVDTFMPRTILTNFGACSSQIWSKISLYFWGLNNRPILGATQLDQI